MAGIGKMPGPRYAFRAEMPEDVEKFLGAIKRADPDRDSGMVIFATTQFPERHVELVTYVELDELRKILCGIEDSHLILQTLRPGGIFEGGGLERYYFD